MEEERVMLQFKAGRLILAGTRLQPDTRKGYVRVARSGDGLLHVQWCERTADGTALAVEDDTILFPEEAVFEKASQSNQRVYVLKFASESDRNMFFWLQEVDPAQDAAVCSQMNEIINTQAAEDDDEDEMETDLSPEEAARLLGSASAGPGSAGASQDPKVLAAMLSNMLGTGLQQALHQHQAGGASTSGSNPAAATQLLAELAAMNQRRRVPEGPSLADILKPEVLAPLLREPDMLAGLAEHLPEGQQDAAQLAKLAHSAQFQQQLQTFSAALQTGQLDVTQFGLQPKGFAVADFLEAIQDLVDNEASSRAS